MRRSLQACGQALAALAAVLFLATVGCAAWALYDPATRMPSAESLPFTLSAAEQDGLLYFYSPDPARRADAACLAGQLALDDPEMAGRLVPFMIGLIGDCDSPDRPRPALSVAYVKSLWTPPDPLKSYCDFIGNRSCRPGISAMKALASVGKPAAEPLLKVLRESRRTMARHNAARALGRIDDPRAQEAAIAAIKDPAWEVRAGAVDGIEESLASGNKSLEPVRAEAVASILVAAHDENPVVRETVVWALSHDDSSETRNAILVLFHDRVLAVRTAAVRAMSGFGSWGGAELVKVLRDPDTTVREEAAWVLKRLTNGATAETLREALKDDDPYVRETAAAALESRGKPK